MSELSNDNPMDHDFGEAVPTGTTTILCAPTTTDPVLPPNLVDAESPPKPCGLAESPKPAKRSPRNLADKLSGKTLGVYRCETLLGRGAMGAVYLAVHQQLERRCALKVLSPKYVESDVDYVNRFRQEAIAVANLHHPHVIMAYAVGEQEGLHFLEMEFVAGNSLQKLLDTQQRLSPTDALRITAQMADGLAAAHRAGLIHRDVKPENVLVAEESHGVGRAKIGDFGLAKRVRGRGEKVFDGLVGTPHYMAPELFRGAQASPATDVYALGVTLYRMLTGKLPYNGKTVKQLMSQVANHPFPEVGTDCPALPAEVTELLRWLIARDPQERASDADQVQPRLFTALEQIRDVRQLVNESFRSEPDIEWSPRLMPDEFDVIVKLRSGRQQRVVIAPTDGDKNIPIRQLQIFSIGGPAQPHHYEVALRRNARIPHGTIAVRDIDGQPHFVIVENHSRAKVSPEELARSVRQIARHADEVERFLTGDDVN